MSQAARKMPPSVRAHLLGDAAAEHDHARREPTRDDLIAAAAAGLSAAQIAADWGIQPQQVYRLRFLYGLTQSRKRRSPAPASPASSVAKAGSASADYLWRYLGGLSVLFERLGDGQFDVQIDIQRRGDGYGKAMGTACTPAS